MYHQIEQTLTQHSCSGMEIHEYMNAKSAFMIKMLKMSNQLSDAESEDIQKATSSAVRMAPIRFNNFVMREFVIGDVEPLLRAGLASTIRDAEELTVDIIRNAGMAKRKHVELAILVRENREEHEVIQMVGRVGVRIVQDMTAIGADRALMRVLDAIPMESRRLGPINLLYAFFDPSRDNVTTARDALDAFVPALAQTVQKDQDIHSVATDADSVTVWHLLRDSELVRITDSSSRGDIVFQIHNRT
jgi:hypothetical protein